MRCCIAILITLSILFVPPVVADGGCGGGGTCPPIELMDPSYIEPNHIDGGLVLTGDELLTGEVYVNGSLRLEGCRLTLEGSGMVVNGSLTMVNSTIIPSSGNLTFFLEVWGDLVLEDSTIIGCLDPRYAINIIGLYVYNGAVSIQRSSMESSGISMLYNCSSDISGSTVAGTFMDSGDHHFVDSTVTSYGLTYQGDGTLSVTGCSIISDIEFANGVSGISATGEGTLDVRSCSIGGTYAAGIFAQGPKVILRDLVMDLDHGSYGVKIDLCEVRTMENISVRGAKTGVSVYGSTVIAGAMEFGDLEIRGGSIGLFYQGAPDAKVTGSIFEDNAVGIRCMGPLDISEATISGGNISILLEGGHSNRIEDCTFSGYDTWAVQEQSWDDMERYPDNAYTPGAGSKGHIAWWGFVEIEVKGNGDIPLPGAMVVLRDELGEYRRSPGELDVIWGYIDREGGLVEVIYDGVAQYGTSSVEFSLDPDPTGGPHLVEIQLSDVHIDSMERKGDRLIVTVGMTGSGSTTAVVSAFIDGILAGEGTVEISSGGSIDVAIDLGDIEAGKHDIRAEVFSPHEYRGAGMQENNSLSIRSTWSKDVDRSDLLTWVLVTVTVLFCLALLMLGSKPKD